MTRQGRGVKGLVRVAIAIDRVFFLALAIQYRVQRATMDFVSKADANHGTMNLRSRPRVDVCTCFDRNMAMPAAILLQSIIDTLAKTHNLRLHAFHSKDANLDGIAAYQSSAHPNVTIRFYQMDEASMGNIPLQNFPISAYYRLFIEDYIEDIDRFIFLDADTLVRSDLAPLFEMDLQGFALAACHDWIAANVWADGETAYNGGMVALRTYIHDVVGLERLADYMNSGVMVVDLQKWRQLEIGQRCRAFCRNHAALVFPDQDALNHCLSGAYLRLDPNWNALAAFAKRQVKPITPFEKIQDGWARDPRIVHFAGKAKPWIPTHSATCHDRLYWKSALRATNAAAFCDQFASQRAALSSDARRRAKSLPFRLQLLAALSKRN